MQELICSSSKLVSTSIPNYSYSISLNKEETIQLNEEHFALRWVWASLQTFVFLLRRLENNRLSRKYCSWLLQTSKASLKTNFAGNYWFIVLSIYDCVITHPGRKRITCLTVDVFANIFPTRYSSEWTTQMVPTYKTL